MLESCLLAKDDTVFKVVADVLPCAARLCGFNWFNKYYY